MSKLLHPQEIEVYYVLPTLRKYLAGFMKEQGKSQKEIANLLHVNSAAVSQYVNEKRANKIHFDDRVLAEIKNSAQGITDTVSMLR